MILALYRYSVYTLYSLHFSFVLSFSSRVYIFFMSLYSLAELYRRCCGVCVLFFLSQLHLISYLLAFVNVVQTLVKRICLIIIIQCKRSWRCQLSQYSKDSTFIYFSLKRASILFLLTIHHWFYKEIWSFYLCLSIYIYRIYLSVSFNVIIIIFCRIFFHCTQIFHTCDEPKKEKGKKPKRCIKQKRRWTYLFEDKSCKKE